MRKGRYFVLGAILMLSSQPASAASTIRIGSSKAVVDHTWRPDGSPCFGGICGYKTWYHQPLEVTVGFTKGRANALQPGFDPDKFVGKHPDPSPAIYWRLLTSFLPSGAHKRTCKTVRKTGMGPAYACVYGYRGRTILVAHYLTTAAGLDIGRTDLDEDFDAITTAWR